MILRHREQAMRSGGWFLATLVVGVLCALAAISLKDPPVAVGIFIAGTAVCAFAAASVFYCHAILCLARAKGYSAAFFTSVFAGPFLAILMKKFLGDSLLVPLSAAMGPLLPLFLALFLPDEGNAARDLEDSRYAGARCVQCNGRIPSTVKLCPHCGYTQPAGDVSADSPQPAAASPAG